MEAAEPREAEDMLDPVQRDIAQPRGGRRRADRRVQQRVFAEPGAGRRVRFAEGQTQPGVLAEDRLPRRDQNERHQRQGRSVNDEPEASQATSPRSTGSGGRGPHDTATDRA